MDWKTPPQEPEGIRWALVIAIMAATLVVFGAGVAVEWVMADVRMEARNPAYGRIPAGVDRQTVNLLEQVPFPVARDPSVARERQLRALDSYGWVDRGQGVVHVPVESVFPGVAGEAGGR